MSWDFLLWIFAFILQAALLGKGMFTLITLADLESDHTNPFDCSVAVNRFVVRLGIMGKATKLNAHAWDGLMPMRCGLHRTEIMI